jgi:hypothetical protein
MEEDILSRINQLFRLYPEIEAGEDLDPLIMRDIARLASHHERIAELFSLMRERLGVSADGEAPASHDTNEGRPDEDTTEDTTEEEGR